MKPSVAFTRGPIGRLRLAEVLPAAGKMLSEILSPGDIAAFCSVESLTGFEFEGQSRFVSANNAQWPFAELLGSKTPRFKCSLFAGLSSAQFFHRREDFLDFLRHEDQSERLYLHPYVPINSESSHEPFFTSQWDAVISVVFESDHVEVCLKQTARCTDDLLDKLLPVMDFLKNELSKRITPSRHTQEPGQANATVQKCQNELSKKAQNLQQSIEAVQKDMALGHCYLLNLTCTLADPVKRSDFKLSNFLRSWWLDPSRFGVFLLRPEASVMSFTPERFVACHDGWIVAEPIKGTLKTTGDAESQKLHAQSLWASKKEICEQSLVVDLLRNDLNSICKPGSVAVHKPFFVRAENGLLQMQSFIFGKLDEPKYENIFRHLLPAGSVTGTPKKNVCTLISKLERTSRGYYTGIFGVCHSSERFESVVLIRSLFANQKEVYTGVGAGITTLSDPKTETYEFEIKLQSFLKRTEHFEGGHV